MDSLVFCATLPAPNEHLTTGTFIFKNESAQSMPVFISSIED